MSKKITYKPKTPYKGKLPTANVKRGSKGESVYRVQTFLNWCDNAKLKTDKSCGPVTEAAIKDYQKTYGLKEDGIFGPKCRAKAKEIIKKHKNDGKTETKPTTQTEPTPQTWQDKAVAWAEKIAKDPKYHYVRWIESNKKTHQCCICHDLPEEDKGFNCIRFVLCAWRHGGGLKIKHEGAVLNDALFDQLLTMDLKKAEKLVSDRLGVKVKLIRNGGKKLSESKLQMADYLVCYNGKKYCHSIMNEGNGRIIDCTSGKKDQIASRPYSTYADKVKLAIRVVE